LGLAPDERAAAYSPRRGGCRFTMLKSLSKVMS
jgi:hypothetical protein